MFGSTIKAMDTYYKLHICITTREIKNGREKSGRNRGMMEADNPSTKFSRGTLEAKTT